ncbi:MAG: TlpA family protein disulfide reductase [Crocinitomicaceae bacterium]|nr:TlpA family protein disulfide reductase [Crocinitomicaceae bacterium]MDP4722843.1 TlpA family protein disulfide reductase [Crocinitomicaceae bacterium]MDP4739867.1 TlpA family protein disulfide reductase [Crocinitomicaceae bacterium]MDP4798763.1 TlpA family protein disulfide reductase [Crocinitomicaceae bacterium]MDP5042003.1 TlpA family protein disulfide reductase [Crocinitomicaceae bacterium]
MRSFIFIIVILLHANFLFAQNATTLPFIAEIQLNDRLQIEVRVSIEELSKQRPLTIYNGKEVYQIAVKKQVGDTTVYGFPAQDAEWRIAFNDDFSDARGWWINYNKKTPVRYPVHLHKTIIELTEVEQTPLNITGKWKVLFQPGTPNEEVLVGVFEQDGGNFVYGSFLSETGDYRYLHGYVANGKLHLQTYTGYWAFVVEADLNGSNEMTGVFYSGGKSSSPFKAIKDETVQLRDEAELTYLIKRDERVVLNNLIKLNGRKTNLDLSKNGQVTLIQIMGTWCPNCIDEANLLKELHAAYGKQGLEIIALGFEVGTDNKKQRSRLKRFVKDLQVNYPVYLAGTSSKEAAAAYFPMLNGIMSFPTSILVDEQGKIIAIHTGFSGPATGAAYTELVNKFKLEIENALE